MSTIFSCNILHLSHLKGLGTSVLKKWLVTVASTFNFYVLSTAKAILRTKQQQQQQQTPTQTTKTTTKNKQRQQQTNKQTKR